MIAIEHDNECFQAYEGASNFSYMREFFDISMNRHISDEALGIIYTSLPPKAMPKLVANLHSQVLNQKEEYRNSICSSRKGSAAKAAISQEHNTLSRGDTKVHDCTQAHEKRGIKFPGPKRPRKKRIRGTKSKVIPSWNYSRISDILDQKDIVDEAIESAMEYQYKIFQ